MILAGVAAVSVPILLYFAFNDALADLWKVYFYDNIFYYSSYTEQNKAISIANNIIGGIYYIIKRSFAAALAIFVGCAFLVKKKQNTEFAFVIACFIGAYVLIFVGGRHYIYYSFIFNSFLPIGFVFVYDIVRSLINKSLQLSNVRNTKAKVYSAVLFMAVSVVSVCTAYECSENVMKSYADIFSDKSDLVQYQFAKIINETEDATLLNYGFLDGGFYTAAGIVPNCKYFTNLNIGIAEIMKTQNEYVENGWVDYVVVQGNAIMCDLYELVAQADGYALYRLKSLSSSD